MPYRHKKKSRLTFLCSLMEEKRQSEWFAKFISPVAKVLIMSVGIFWSSSFDQRIPRVYSPRLCPGNHFPAKKKIFFCSRDLAISRGIFASKSSRDCLEKGESEAELSKSRVTGLAPYLEGSDPKTRSRTGRELPPRAPVAFKF